MLKGKMLSGGFRGCPPNASDAPFAVEVKMLKCQLRFGYVKLN